MKIKRGTVLFVTLAVSLIITSVAFGRDLFLFDLEKNKVLQMGTEETAFTEKVDLDKVPDLIMRTYDPNKILIIYMPKEEDPNKDPDGLATNFETNQAENDRTYLNKGKFMLADLAKGRADDLVDIGYGPYETALSKDKKHFLISYRTEAGGRSFEILHYNIAEKKAEKLSEHYGIVNSLDFSVDSSTAYALVGQKRPDNFEMLTLGLAPFAKKDTLDAGFYPVKVHALTENRLALVDLGGKINATGNLSQMKEVDGTVQLIDSEKNIPIQTITFKPSHAWYDYYKEQNTLLVQTLWYDHRRDSTSELEWFGEGRFIRITGQGMADIQTKIFWDFDYDAKNDVLYVLGDRSLDVYDLKNNKKNTVKTGINWFNEEYSKDAKNYVTTMAYFVKAIPEFNLAIVYSNYKGISKIYDLTTGKLVTTLKGAKIKTQYPEDYKFLTSFIGNAEKKRLYILDRNKKGLSVYNEKCEPVSALDLKGEQPIGLYLIKKPTAETVLVTENGLYKVEEKELKQICKFDKKAKNAYLYQEEKRLVFFVDDDWYVVDPTTYELKYHLNEYGDANDKYTKVKKGERRYYYIPTAYDWSE